MPNDSIRVVLLSVGERSGNVERAKTAEKPLFLAVLAAFAFLFDVTVGRPATEVNNVMIKPIFEEAPIRCARR